MLLYLNDYLLLKQYCCYKLTNIRTNQKIEQRIQRNKYKYAKGKSKHQHHRTVNLDIVCYVEPKRQV